MGALLRTEHVSGREGAATCSQFWRASEAASLICNVLCSPFSFFFLHQTHEVGREPFSSPEIVACRGCCSRRWWAAQLRYP